MATAYPFPKHISPAGEPLHVSVARGAPAELDAFAAAAVPEHRFLNAAWFTAAGAQATLLVRRADGRPLAAIPTALVGPAQLGARGVVGSYWPFRNVPVAADASAAELARLLAHRRTHRALGLIWRVGPFYRDDPGAARLVAAARQGGWRVLTRAAGHSFLLDVAAAQAQGPWPRPSTLKRIGNYERQLAREGALRFERVEGAAWTGRVFDALAAVEEASWIAERTDRSGAKFLNPVNRAFWEAAAAQPSLREMMSALILWVGERPVGFCFDLNVGPLQYSIAGSYDQRFAKLKPGKIATYRNAQSALERGITRIDLGTGDGGYKSEMGAVQGPEIIDCLFVRSPALAAVLRSRWEGARGGEDDLPFSRLEQLLIASLATAAAAAALAE